MKIKFLGTKGYVEGGKGHKKNTSIVIESKGRKIQIDFGESFYNTKPEGDFIFITHGHYDHIGGLTGKEKNVYAPKKVLKFLVSGKEIKPEKYYRFGPIKIKAIPIAHSDRYPTYAYKIVAEGKKILYAPDVLNIKKKYLKDIDVYIGDGAALTKPIVRRYKDTNKPYGHTSIVEQIKWLEKHNKKAKIIITHLGQEVIDLGSKKVEKALRETFNRDIKIPKDNQIIKI